jgi:hypothetical protein
MTAKRRHLSADALQALRDGESGLWSRAWARYHLAMCVGCRADHAAAQAESDRVAELLGSVMQEPGRRWPDPGDAWERFVVRSGAGSRFARQRLAARGAIGAAVAALAVVVMVMAINRFPRSDLVTRMYSLSAQDRIAPKVPTTRDVELARSIASLEARGKLERLSDVCCADRDGEGPADDGVLTVRLAGSRSPVVILYEDTQRTGTFKPGDAVLMVSRPGLSAEELPAGRKGVSLDLRE